MCIYEYDHNIRCECYTAVEKKRGPSPLGSGRQPRTLNDLETIL